MNLLDDLVQKDWYFQGFNGTPTLLYGPAFSMIRNMPDTLGFGYSACIQYFKNDVCYYLYAWDDLYKIRDELLSRFAKDNTYLEYLVTHNEQICKEVLDEYKDIGDKNWKELEIDDLFRLWKKSDQLYAQLLAVSHIVEGFTLTTENRIRELVQKEFPNDYLEKIIVLTTPNARSFIAKEHYELCLIAQRVKDLSLAKKDLSQHKEIFEKIKKHQEKYYWKSNSYTSAKIVSVEDFIDELATILSENKFTYDISEYESLMKILEEKNIVFNIIKDDELKNLLKIQDAIFQIHDRRKECMLQAIHCLDFLMMEIAKRFSLSLADLRYIRATELEELPNIVSELSQRRKGSLYILLPGEKQLLFIGDEADNYFNKLIREKTDLEVSEIHGNCASPGKVEGIVKVCRGESEISKVQEGDILVACMTQPEFLPAMKKASAIITDEGGLTCHAAIVARELKKPCIIGTKNATKILQDGMKVWIDANLGIIKILS